MSKKRKQVLSEKQTVLRFVDALMSKNYKDAHKYLTNTVDSRLRARIGSQLDKPLF